MCASSWVNGKALPILGVALGANVAFDLASPSMPVIATVVLGWLSAPGSRTAKRTFSSLAPATGVGVAAYSFVIGRWMWVFKD